MISGTSPKEGNASNQVPEATDWSAGVPPRQLLDENWWLFDPNSPGFVLRIFFRYSYKLEIIKIRVLIIRIPNYFLSHNQTGTPVSSRNAKSFFDRKK